MPSSASILRPLSSSKAALRQSRQQKTLLRYLSTAFSPTSTPPPPLPSQIRTARRPPPPSLYRTAPKPTSYISPQKLKTYPPPPSIRNKHPNPLTDFTTSQIAALDPTGARTALLDNANPDVPRPGDILLVTFRSGEPFAGICLSIKRRGVDTGLLLRNRLLMTGVEMWIKIYSPNVVSIEVVKRAERRARRARLYYLRKPEHDRGSVQGEVEDYLRKRRLIRSGALGIKDPSKSVKRPEQARSGVKPR